MDNYHYIIAGLPEIYPGWKPGEATVESYIGEIYDNCSSKDRKIIDFFEKGFVAEELTGEFYRKALSHPDRFVREYFRFDLDMRNAKVRYLNIALGRDLHKDEVDSGDEDAPEFEEASRLDSVLQGKDILTRERGMDDILWDKIDSLTVFNYFDIDAILGFIAKLHIIGRWQKLDEKTGREMFRRLVDEVTATFKGVEYDGNIR